MDYYDLNLYTVFPQDRNKIVVYSVFRRAKLQLNWKSFAEKKSCIGFLYHAGILYERYSAKVRSYQEVYR